MNRHQRRAAKAGARPPPRRLEMGDLPSGYMDDIQTMSMALEVWKKELNVVPKFAFPPREYHMLLGIDQVPALARDENARSFLQAACKVCKYWGGDVPTPLMLLAALEAAGVPYETLPVNVFDPDGKFVLVPKHGGGTA